MPNNNSYHLEKGYLQSKLLYLRLCQTRPCFSKEYKTSNLLIIIGRREIKALQVKCNNAERSCEWNGTVGTVKEHLSTCLFALLPCPLECVDNNSKTKCFMRKDLESHVTKNCPYRDHECNNGEDKCGEKGTFYYITQVHDKVCGKKILPCPSLGCLQKMQRQQIIQHVMFKCEHAVIACKYKCLGCNTELKRKDMAAHEKDDKFHLHMAIERVTLQEDGHVTLKQGELVTFKFIDYQVKKESKRRFTSPSFYTSQGYHMALAVDANGIGAGMGTHVSVSVTILPGKSDTYLKWPFVGSFTITLLNQQKDANHNSKTITVTGKENAKAHDMFRCEEFIPHSALGHNPARNTEYLMDDALYFRVSVKVDNNKHWLDSTTTI